MPNETEQTAEQTAAAEALAAEGLSFEDFEKLRNGETPADEDEEATPPAAAEETKPAKTAPDSEPDKDKESEDEEGEEEEGEGKDGKPTKKKGGYQRRIDKLTKKTRDLEAEVQALRQRPAAAAAGEPEQPAAKPAEAATPKPKVEDFESFEEFTEQLVDWKQAQADAKREAKAAETATQTAIQQEYRTRVETFEAREVETRKTHADYDQVLKEADDVPIPWAMTQLLLESEVGPLLAYELAKNPEEAERIAGLQPLAMAREMAKLEAKLSTNTPTQPKPKPATKAPKPVTPVTGGSGATATHNLGDPDLDFAEFERQRNEQQRRRGR